MQWMHRIVQKIQNNIITGNISTIKNFTKFSHHLIVFSATHMSSDPPISRHFLYAKHFPLCQDDTVSQHDTNQRYILLFGVGKERDEKKHAVKKMAKGTACSICAVQLFIVFLF